jgi:hypothetical protein
MKQMEPIVDLVALLEKMGGVKIDGAAFAKLASGATGAAAVALGVPLSEAERVKVQTLSAAVLRQALESYEVRVMVEEIEWLRKMKRVSGEYFLGETEDGVAKVEKTCKRPKTLTTTDRIRYLEYTADCGQLILGMLESLRTVQKGLTPEGVQKPVVTKGVRSAPMTPSPILGHLKQVTAAREDRDGREP